MKKRFLISVSLLAIAVSISVLFTVANKNDAEKFLDVNVEALMAQEHAYGKCNPVSSQECWGYCSDCGELVYASGYQGEGYDIHH